MMPYHQLQIPFHPNPQTDTDPAHQLHALAEQLLARLARGGQVLTAHVRDIHGASVTIRVRPAPPPKLTPCERDLLTLLRGATEPLTTSRVLDQLARRGMIHGEATIRRALARLARNGVILASRRVPRGYRMPVDEYRSSH